MARPPRIDRADGIYHLTSRGNARGAVFFADADRERFLERLRDNLETYNVVLYAFVLMDNHFHLLVRTPDANLSRFAQRLKTAYALYLRYKRKKPGHIFQGRFHAKLVESRAYLTRVSRYIHLNPVRTKAAMALSERDRLARLHSWRWSSLPVYLRASDDALFVETGAVLREFGGQKGAWGGARRAYRRYVEACVTKADPETIDLMNGSRYVIGSEDFVHEIEDELAARRSGASADDDLDLPRPRVGLGDVDRAVCERFDIAPNTLKRHGRSKGGEAKAVAVEVACLLTGHSQRAIGQWYGGLTNSGVRHARDKTRGNAKLRAIVAEVVEAIREGIE